MANKRSLAQFPSPQIKAVFIQRPQRFLAEVQLSDGTKTMAYCANPGSLKDCLKKNSPALLWDSGDAKRSRRYTLRAVKINNVWVGTDTHLANNLVEKAFEKKLLPFLKGYKISQKEKQIQAGVRIDFLLTKKQSLCFIEVKSATVVNEGKARFPDSITPRSLKQLLALTKKAKQGHRAILLFVVQRGDAKSFELNEQHYPAYTTAFKKALAAGVEVQAIGIELSQRGFANLRLLPIKSHA